MMTTWLLAIVLVTNQPSSIGEWKPVYDSSGRLLMLRWEDASGNLHVRFPLSRFAVVPDARTWTPARTPSGEYCWAIRTDDWIQTWQSRESRGRKFRSTEEFVLEEGQLPNVRNFGLVFDRVADSAKKQEKNQLTYHGNGPATPAEYDQQVRQVGTTEDNLLQTHIQLAVACVLLGLLVIYRWLSSRS